MENTNVNQGHRQRMKDKLLKNPDSMSDHEILEILLYYVFSRKDTNKIAHCLLSRGKDLNGVLSLDEKVISSVEGLGEKSAEFIFVLREFTNRIEKEKKNLNSERKLTKKTIADRVLGELGGLLEERFIMLTCDKDMNYINTHIISKGQNCTSYADVKKVVSEALFDGAAYVFLAHNHPNGMLVKSQEDEKTTIKITEALSYIDVSLIEHFIVNDNAMVGILGRY